MGADYYAACEGLLGITLPLNETYDYETLYKSIQPPDQPTSTEGEYPTHEKGHRLETMWNVTDLLHSDEARDIPDDILYTIC